MARAKVFRRMCDVCGKEVDKKNGFINHKMVVVSQTAFSTSYLVQVKLDICNSCMHKSLLLKVFDYDGKGFAIFDPHERRM